MSMENSFTSFVDYETASPSEADGMACVSRRLLPGEIECTSCDDVSFGFQFQDALSGNITCTNFCIFFQPFVVSSAYRRLPRRFSIYDEQFCIPLCSIEAIYYSVNQADSAPSSKDLKELTSPISSMEAVSYIKLCLKDFRVALIDMTRTQHAPNFANQLLCFSRPASVEHLVQAGAHLEWIRKVQFNSEDCWRQELNRCCAKGNWRLCNMTKEVHKLVHSYSMYVVVPYDVVTHDINQMIEHYRSGRFPVWVWSAPSGAALLRSSASDDGWLVKEAEKRYISAVCANTNSRHQTIDINEAMSTTAVAAAFKKLRKLCSIDSHASFDARENEWFTKVHNTGWLQLVGFCLRTAAEILIWMLDRGTSVTITEPEGVDMSAVISSLVQICGDSENRTTAGLERLIAKEWIALGHPFGQRICGINRATTAPTFLLFLDCLAQLRRCYPMQFGFSDHLLIALWDLSLSGCVPAFACSSVVEQLSSGKTGGPFPLSRFFTEEYRNLFSNPVNDAAQMVQKTSRSPLRTRLKVEPAQPLLCDVIRPPFLPIDLELWDLCYMRWIPRANTLTTTGVVSTGVALDEVMGQLSQNAGLFWKNQMNTVDTDCLGSAYPYSLPLKSPYIPSSNLSDQMDTLSLSSSVTFQHNSLRELKSPSRSNSLSIPEPAPRRHFRNAPPPPKKSPETVFRTHF